MQLIPLKIYANELGVNKICIKIDKKRTASVPMFGYSNPTKS